jgi:hypothetical protein
MSYGKVILDTKAKLFLQASLFILIYNMKTASPAELELIVFPKQKLDNHPSKPRMGVRMT